MTETTEQPKPTELQQATIDALRVALSCVSDLDAELAAREQELSHELAAVQSERRRLRGLIRAANPEAAPARPGRRPGNGGWERSDVRTAPYSIAEDRVEVVRALLAERFAEGEFSSTEVFTQAGALLGGSNPATRRGMLSKALARLRERGQIRLVKVMRGRSGGNIYVATAKIAEPWAAGASPNGDRG
jgi:hypothetical protein